MSRAGTLLRKPAVLLITALVATDVVYRRLVRPTIRRGLGIRS